MKVTKFPNNVELFEFDIGGKAWYRNGLLHKDDGPACEHANGDKLWFLNGKLHREDGPSCEWIEGDKEWWLNNEQIPCTTQKQFEQLMRLKAFW